MILVRKYYFDDNNVVGNWEKYTEKQGKKYMIKFNPLSQVEDWNNAYRDFLRKLRELERGEGINWSASSVYHSEEHRYSRTELLNSTLFAMDTGAYYFGNELLDTRSDESRCPFCGSGPPAEYPVKIDDLSILSAETGFTDRSTLIFHHSVIKALKSEGLTGVEFSPVASDHDDKIQIHIFGCRKEKLEGHLSETLARLGLGFERHDVGSHTFLFLDSRHSETAEFLTFYEYFDQLYKDEELEFRIYSPNTDENTELNTKWAKVRITGSGIKESAFNDYVSGAKCRECGSGYVPDGILNVNVDEWDGTDFCLTDVGRICLSKKAYKILKMKFRWVGEPTKVIG